MDELTAEMFEIEDKEDLIDEIMNKYGQEILQLVYSYVNHTAFLFAIRGHHAYPST